MYYQKENFSGTYDFRCRWHDGYIMNSHIHEYSEILYCKKGSGNIFVNRKKINLCAGEFVFIPPNFIHQYHCEKAEMICAVFSNDFIPLFFKLTKGKKLVVSAINSDELKSIFESLPMLDNNNAILITAYLNLICNKVIEQGYFEKASLSDSILYQKVISYISENFRQNITLKKIGHNFGYNEKYLSSVLHSLTGMHFSDLISLYRVNCAKELLAKRCELSVTEISVSCGFAAVNTFNRQFKKIVLMTPTQYRNLYCKE